jgi:hypothetical protein
MADNGNAPIISKKQEAGMEMSDQSPPDYGSSPRPKSAPPSYDSIMKKIMDARQESKTPVHFVGKTSQMVGNAAMSTFCLVLSLAIPITMVVLGSIYISNCPLERQIPTYMIVSGALYIAKSLTDLFINEYRRRYGCNDKCGGQAGGQGEGQGAEGQAEETKEDKPAVKVANFFSGSLGVVIFAFLIAGSVWVYSNFAPSNDPQSARYCHPTLYYFAFWQITGTYIMIGLVLTCISCCCVFACTAGCCCKAASNSTDCEAGRE